MKCIYVGPLASEFGEFASLMRSTGAPHAATLKVVARLDRFLKVVFPGATSLTKEMLLQWFASFEHLQLSSQQRYRGATFQLCKFLRSRNPAVPLREDFEPFRRPRRVKAYIFSVEEVTTLIRAARRLKSRDSDPLRAFRTELVLALLYTAGLRIGEVVRLKVGDYDAVVPSLTIRETKFGKSRIVPLSTSAKQLVDTYLKKRREFRLHFLPEDSLLCGPRGRSPCLGAIQEALTRLMRQCGLKPETGRQGPRVHDFRHTFAVHRILQWYQAGENVQALLPRLVTFMGHQGLESTQYYLSITPDVLNHASRIFERFAAVGGAGR